MVGDQYWYDVTVRNNSASLTVALVTISSLYNPLWSNGIRCVSFVQATHPSCQNYSGEMPSVECSIQQALAPYAALTLRLTFQADRICAGQQNENMVRAVAYYGGQGSASATDTALVTIVERVNRADDSKSQGEGPESDAIVVNAGAVAVWRYNGLPGQMTSNPVTNPAHSIYLPKVYRRN